MSSRALHLSRSLPPPLQGLDDLALDVRWTWNHQADALWRRLDPETWAATQNAWLVLQGLSWAQLEQLAQDDAVVAELGRQLGLRRAAREQPAWYERTRPAPDLKAVAYFSMEFGLSEALPLYSGGLGVLAGDMLKTASDLGVPVVGVGLLYQTGTFRQVVDARGVQLALYPYNNPMLLPVLPAVDEAGAWQVVRVPLPGRVLLLRCWRVNVGRVTLYLLDSNDPRNSPADRGITGDLYVDAPELRLQQQFVLGIGGYRALERRGVHCNVLHLNEGHAAFAALERARSFMKTSGKGFDVALACTRAGNLFTTHTAVRDAFDRYDPHLVARYFESYASELGIGLERLLALGRMDPRDPREPFAMPLLALRCAGRTNAVSRLHGEVSRALFQPLFPRWPAADVPVGHVTNGVHVPSWDSADADRVWEESCGRGRWMGELVGHERGLRSVPDATLWEMRNAGRRRLVAYVQARNARTRPEEGASAALAHVLDPDVLTLGIARRFARYKRPALLLHDRARLERLLRDPHRPLQIVIAGKSHPNDPNGLALLKTWMEFIAAQPLPCRVAFLEDYDLTMAQQLVQGVDVWLNTPRRPWEACGTSGMKVLVNGGLNVSVADGWWAEHYSPEVGFVVGDAHASDGADVDVDEGDHVDARDAQSLYDVLERQVVPEFYERDVHGLPARWVARLRESMLRLTPACSSNRMLREYVGVYAELSRAHKARCDDGCALAERLVAQRARLDASWNDVRFGQRSITQAGPEYEVQVHVYLDDLDESDVCVELFAEQTDEAPERRLRMTSRGRISGATRAFLYEAKVPADRPSDYFTPRVVASDAVGQVPLELPHIAWEH